MSRCNYLPFVLSKLKRLRRPASLGRRSWAISQGFGYTLVTARVCPPRSADLLIAASSSTCVRLAKVIFFTGGRLCAHLV